MLLRTLVFVLSSFLLLGCTLEVIEPEPILRCEMSTKKPILDTENPNLLGKSAILVPGLTTNAEPVIGGYAVFTQDFPIIRTQGCEESPDLITLAFDALPILQPAASVAPDYTAIQAVLKFGSGNAQFGASESTVLQASTRMQAEVIVDIQYGTVVVVPASALNITLRYLAAVNGTFGAGSQLQAFKVNVGMAYGAAKTAVGTTTKTDPPVKLAAAGAFTFNKAKFAQSIEMNWSPYSVSGGAALGPLNLSFFSFGGTPILDASIGTNILPPPRIPWPAGAQFLSVTNGSAGLMPSVSCKQYLTL